MSRDMAYLLDILINARDIQQFTQGKDWETFSSDGLCQKAVLWCLEVMGEAVKRLSPETRMAYPEIPWSGIAGMRDFLIHGYNQIDLRRVWDTAIKDIPQLIINLEKIVPPDDEA